MWAIVLVAGIALVMCGAIVWALGLSSVSADATNRLEHSRDRIRQLAADRQDPSSGQPLEDVSAVLRTHIQRTAEGRGEAELGFVGTDASTKLTWVSASEWTFEPVDNETFPAINLARFAVAASATHPAVLNAANEGLVDAFIAGEVPWLAIVDTVASVVHEHEGVADPSLDDIVAAQRWADQRARELVRVGQWKDM